MGDLFDPLNDLHLFCSHHVFIPRINRALKEFVPQHKSHRLRTEHCYTPNNYCILCTFVVMWNPFTTHHQSHCLWVGERWTYYLELGQWKCSNGGSTENQLTTSATAAAGLHRASLGGGQQLWNLFVFESSSDSATISFIMNLFCFAIVLITCSDKEAHSTKHITNLKIIPVQNSLKQLYQIYKRTLP